MKLPETAPDWRDVLARNPERPPSLLTFREARECVEKANLEYLHWERAKYLNVTPPARELPQRMETFLHALKHPEAAYSIEPHKNSHNIVRATARADLFALVERGYLSRGKQGRRYYFRAAPGIAEKLNLSPEPRP